MDKDVRPYKQRKDTCAIACMMMVIEYYNNKRANWNDERKYYKLYGSKYMSGTPFSALAYHFSKNNLDTTIYHFDDNLFNNNNNTLDDNIFLLALDEYKIYLDRAKSKNAKIVNGVDININLLRSELQSGKIIVLAGENNGVYHAILISGFDGNNFIICDPLYKEKQVRTPEYLESFMDTSIGKWFISVGDKTKEKDNLNNMENEQIVSFVK